MITTRIFDKRVTRRVLSATNRIRRGFGGWAFVASSVIAAGFLISLVGAKEIAHNDDAKVRQSFETSALDISGALHASLQHEEDLVVATGAFVAANKGATSAQLEEWIVSVQAQERYPELLGVGAMAFVRDADLIKIDRSFISTIASSAESAALVHTLVQLGKNLGFMTLAEGVETTDELDHLREADVDHAQGFLLAGPLSAEGVEAQLMIPGLRDELAADSS